MIEYLDDVWRCRHFWMSLVKMDLRTRYRHSILGLGWSLLNPIAFTTIICLVFHQVFQVNVREYAPFLLAGLSFWNFITYTSVVGAESFRLGEAYIRQCPLPMAIYPLRAVMSGAVHYLIAVGVTLATTIVLKGMPPLAPLAIIPFALLLVLLFGWAMATMLAVANVFFPDSKHLTDIGFQILFYATPIIYPTSRLGNSMAAQVLSMNPLGMLINLLRDPLVEGRFPTTTSLVGSSMMVGIAVMAAAAIMRRVERRLIFHL